MTEKVMNELYKLFFLLKYLGKFSTDIQGFNYNVQHFVELKSSRTHRWNAENKKNA